jgi:hypothetical protein
VDIEPISVYVSNDSPLELIVNFGVFARRETTRPDIDKLGEVLLGLVSGATLFAGHRYEFAHRAAESAAYEVRIEFPPFILPTEEAELEPLVDKLLEAVRAWARDCAATPPAGREDLAARIARGSLSER